MSMARTSILWGDLRKTLWAKKQGSLRKENSSRGFRQLLRFVSRYRDRVQQGFSSLIADVAAAWFRNQDDSQ